MANKNKLNEFMKSFVVLMAIAMLPLCASASSISGPLLGFTATGPLSYSPDNNFFGGSGTGVLTAAAGSLPVGTAIDWYIEGGFYPNPATVAGNTITQSFTPMITLSVWSPTDLSNLLSGGAFSINGGYATGVLNAPTAQFGIQFGGLTSSYISTPSTAWVYMAGMTSVPIAQDPNCIVCPSIAPFDMDWSFSLPNSSTPEPSSLSLLGTGALALSTLKRRRTGNKRRRLFQTTGSEVR